jgi:branched-chain amino acid aminotransferase
VTDHIISRGIGVFDSIRSYDRIAFALDEHMKRLEESARKIGIETGEIVKRIEKIIIEGVRRDDCPNQGNCIVKAYITGGDANNKGLFPHPRFFVIFEEAEPLDENLYKTGVALYPSPEGRPYPLIKSINYLIGIMQSVGRDDVLECLYCPDGMITETLRSSFFMCKDNVLITAPVGAVLGGVTRNIVIDVARMNGFFVNERSPRLLELEHADEAFITSTWKEVMPVVRVGDMVIGGGKPGPITERIGKLFRASRDRWLRHK